MDYILFCPALRPVPVGRNRAIETVQSGGCPVGCKGTRRVRREGAGLSRGMLFVIFALNRAALTDSILSRWGLMI